MDKGKKLKNSKPFIDALWSEAEEVDNLTNTVVDKVKSHLGLQRFSRSKYSSNTKVILLNLFCNTRG
jgi:alpha-D-ribose 1-methylphosphonate 5-triphosphate synthase subunit PhnG